MTLLYLLLHYTVNCIKYFNFDLFDKFKDVDMHNNPFWEHHCLNIIQKYNTCLLQNTITLLHFHTKFNYHSRSRETDTRASDSYVHYYKT
jgi:hypothetical protein